MSSRLPSLVASDARHEHVTHVPEDSKLLHRSGFHALVAALRGLPMALFCSSKALDEKSPDGIRPGNPPPGSLCLENLREGIHSANQVVWNAERVESRFGGLLRAHTASTVGAGINFDARIRETDSG